MLSWLPNWDQIKQHYIDWWNHQGLVVNCWTYLETTPRETVEFPGEAPDANYFYTHPQWRALSNHYHLARQHFCLDAFPDAGVDIGPGSLALYMGSKPGLSWETVWFEPLLFGSQPEEYGCLRLDFENPWWKLTEESLRASVALGQGKYITGCVDLVENIDILASLRDPQTLLLDMIDRPSWVEEKVWEINQAWFQVYDRIYDIIKLPDNSSAWAAFQIWGPGKVAKVQCDTCAMFSPRMFKRFVVPALTEQCNWLDHSMYHLDGHQCIPHLDQLLQIESLDAIEWTPDPQVPSGGDPCWYDMYRKIIAAGKSVQAIGVSHDQIAPLIDAVGPKGLYIGANIPDAQTAENIAKLIEQYR